jgi:hypothetical protein
MPTLLAPVRLASLVLLAAALVAQQPEGEHAAEVLPQVVLPPKDGVVSVMRSFSQGLTIDADGKVWCLSYVSGVQQDSRELWLHKSDDDGRSWRRIRKAPTAWTVYGALVGAPQERVLHVAYAARVGDQKWTSALYQRFDIDQEVWLGEPEVLQRGTGGEDQFSICDLALGDDGAVTVLVSTHRRPKRPPWPSGWSSGLLVRGKGEKKWQGPFPIHTSTYGVWANLQLRDGTAHTTYRSSPSHSIIGYRSFAMATQKFEQKKDVEISVRPKTGRYVSNSSSLVVHPFGSRTVLYPAASQGRGQRNGQLLLAFADEDDRWVTSVLCDDPAIVAGNYAYEYFALVQGPGTQAIALYSKMSENYRVLYRRFVDAGRPLGREQVVARSDLDGAFQRIVAMRDPRVRTGVQALVSGQGAGAALGVRAVLAPRPVKTRWQ